MTTTLRSLTRWDSMLPADMPDDDYIARLRDLVERAAPALLRLAEDDVTQRPSPERWSPKETLGHLIDSAANNHQRFVRAQEQDDLVFPGYEQDAWVQTQRYREAEWPSLVTLWWMYNTHLVRVMEAVPAAIRFRPHAQHNLDEIAWRPFPAGVPATLDDLMRDYDAHLRHHLAQLLPADVALMTLAGRVPALAKSMIAVAERAPYRQADSA